MGLQHCGGRRARGLTLIELLFTLALVAVLTSIALPSFGQQLARQRLKAAAETLAADLAEARFEAARQGRPLHLAFAAGPAWCYAVATVPGCDCRTTQPCQLKTVQASDVPGVELLQGQDTVLDPQGGAAGGTAALWRSRQGEQLAVSLSPLGRARVCSPAGGLGYTRC